MSLLRFRPRCDTLCTMKVLFQAGLDGPVPAPPGKRFLLNVTSSLFTLCDDLLLCFQQAVVLRHVSDKLVQLKREALRVFTHTLDSRLIQGCSFCFSPSGNIVS